jgi:hypothetical protein
VPLRLAPLLPATRRVTVPSPWPDAPDATVIHDTCEVAVQEQSLRVVTATEIVALSGPTFSDDDPSA